MPRDKKDPADRREEIIVATLDLIIASGVERLRATDVAERLGVSSGLIFYHFDTIENLIVRAFEFAAERDLARLDAVLATADGTMKYVTRRRARVTRAATACSVAPRVRASSGSSDAAMLMPKSEIGST